MRRKPKGNAAAILCWTDLRNAVSEKTIFNNEQVTCVGARVVGKTIIERATMPDLDLLIIVIKARFSYSAKAIPMTDQSQFPLGF